MSQASNTEQLLEEIGRLRQQLCDLQAAHNRQCEVEAALTESQRRLSTLMSNLPGMAYRCRNDPDWTMEFVSQGCFALTGRSPSEVLLNRAVSWNDLIRPENRQAVWDGVQQAVAKKRQFQVTYRICTPSGEEKWVWEQGTGIFSPTGKLEALEGFITDITDRVHAEEDLRRRHDELEQRVVARTRQLAETNAQLRDVIVQRQSAEDALRQSNEQLQAIYDGMQDGLVLADIESRRLLRTNPAMLRMTGYAEEELLSRSVEDLHPPAERSSMLESFRAHAEGHDHLVENRAVQCKDGSVFYVDISTSRILYRDRPCLLGFFRDITSRKQSQEALNRERQTLRHMLRASDHERQLIAYEIHDGLAQQLAAAIMQFQSFDFLRQRNPHDAKTAYDAGMQMLRQAHAETRRLISGVRPPILDESGITAAVAHLVHDTREAGGPEIEFTSRVAFDRLPPVLENAVYRIAQEALTNACKHSHSPKVRVSLLQDDGQLHLEVLDWGAGFNPQSTGPDRFGLAGIRERARFLGGTAAIESRPGEGTRVRVSLPLVATEPPPHA